jgi:hypothetical protein
MSQYASKTASGNESSSCQREINDLSEELRQLKNAKKKTEDVIRAVKALHWLMSGYKDSLNEAFGGFSWEGTTVRDVQKTFGDALFDMGTYIGRYNQGGIENRLRLIDARISAVQREIIAKGMNKVGLEV